MGVHGVGNFDNDSGADFVGSISSIVNKEIAAFMASDRVGIEDVDCIMGCIEVKIALVRSCHWGVPRAADVDVLKQKLLQVYDRTIDLMAPQPGYKEKRPIVIQETLETLRSMAKT